MNYTIPQEVLMVLAVLESNDFEAYIVGGCVRDLLHGRDPADWDVTTNANPEEIIKLFPDSVYENDFGTVGVKTDSEDLSLKIVEVTPFRTESVYSDKRHPDKVKFAQKIGEDIKRRDFTMNSLALRVVGENQELIDLFDGEKDLNNGIIRAVGDPRERFNEDALRLLRAVRFAAQLNFEIEEETKKAIYEESGLIQFVAKERIRDEFSKLIVSKFPQKGIELLHELGLLKHIAPEIEEGIDVGQNLHHIYTVWEHNLRSMQYAAEHDYGLEVTMSALLHDVGKPRTKRGNGEHSTFYGHDVVGARMTSKILSRLRYSKAFIEKVTKLVRYHLFYYNVDEVTASSVRRLICKVGVDDMEDLIRLRISERIGSGVPKAEPYKLRHFRFMVEKLQRDPISVGMLKVKGNDVMEAGVESGPRIGYILNILLEEVLDDPKRNDKAYLLKKMEVLIPLSNERLKELADRAKNKSSALEEEEVDKIKKKHYVK